MNYWNFIPEWICCLNYSVKYQHFWNNVWPIKFNDGFENLMLLSKGKNKFSAQFKCVLISALSCAPSLYCRWWRTITVRPTTRTPAWSLSLCIMWQRCCAGLLRCRPTEIFCSASRTCRAHSACAPASRTPSPLSAGVCWNLWRSCNEVRKCVHAYSHTFRTRACM